MLKKLPLSVLFLISCFNLSAQQDSAKYSGGDLPTTFTNIIDLTDESFGCSDTLRVTIPAGNYVTSVDVYYAIEAKGTGEVSDQGSYLECLSTTNSEAGISFGDPLWDSIGIYNYARTGLTIANGISATGDLDFFLHAFRNAVFAPGLCSGNAQAIVNDSWRVIVHHSPPPTCLPPSIMVATAVTSTSLTFNWTSGGASNWQIEYGLNGFTPGTGTVIPVNSNPFTVNSLSPNTIYNFRLRDSCGVGDVSFWTGLVGYKTSCITQSLPYTENFNADAGCFEIFNGGTSNDTWGQTTNAGQNLDGTGYMRVDSDAAGNGPGLIETLRSPVIDASSFTGTLVLDFDQFFRSLNQQDSGYVQVFDGSNWVTVYEVAATAGGFSLPDHQSIDITAHANANLQVRFTYTDNGTWAWYWLIDNFSVRAVSCLDASGLAWISSTTTDANVTWVSGGASNWNVEYGPSGFTQGGGTTINATNDTLNIPSLSAGSCYDFYVRDSCGVGDVGLWAGPFTFCTLCNPISAPWSENFDGANWTTGIGGANTGNIIDACWARPSATNPNFGTRTAATVSGGTGPSADVSGTGNYLYTEASNGATGPGEINSPQIIVSSSIVTPHLNYSYHMFGAGIVSLEVQIDNGSGFTSLKTITGQQQTANADLWIVDTIDLSAYSGDTVTLKFIGTNNNFAGDIGIDEISIDEAPTCFSATDQGLNASSTTSAEVYWTGAGASNWNVEYGAQGFVLGSGTLLNVTNDTITIGSLNASTCYDFFVRDSCGLGDVGPWVGPFTFCTLCNPIAAPWLENFDGANWTTGAGGANTANIIDACWVRPSLDNPNFGTRTGATISGGTGPDTDVSGTGNYLYTEASNGAQGPGEINSPQIIVSTSIITPLLSYSYHMFGADIVSLEVQLDNGSGFTSLKTITGQQQTANADLWIVDTIDLSAYSGDTVTIKFIGTNTNFAGDISIDEVSIDEAPTCFSATNQGVSDLSFSSAEVYWTGAGASNWNVEYGLQGFTLGSGTALNSTNDTTVLANLNPGACYDFFVRDSCGLGDVGPWVGPFTFCTLCNPIAAPWSENFDAANWTSGAGGANAGNIIDACWVRPSIDNPNFGTRTGVTQTPTSGALTDVSGGGNYLYTEASNGANGPGEINSPQIIVSTSIVSPLLSYSYHMFGADITSLEVQIDRGSGFVSERILTGQQQTASADLWLVDTIDLSAYSGDTITVKFIGTNTNFNGDISIDEVSIDEAPSCFTPSDLGVSRRGVTNSDLFWTSGGASNWNVEIGVQGFTQGTGTIINAANDTLTVGSLTANTCYDFYVRDSCGLGDVGLWFGPFTFCTLCNAINAPWTENFDAAPWISGNGGNNAANIIDNCWQRPTEDNPNFGTRTAATLSGATGPDADVSGAGNYLYTEASNGATGSGEITSPLIVVSSSLTNPALFYNYHLYGGDIISLEIQIDNGSGFTTLKTITGPQQTANNDAWILDTASLAAYSGDTILIKFIGTNSGFNGDVAIDEIGVDEAPSCNIPVGLGLEGVLSNSASVYWTSGGATNWQIEFGPTGFTPGSGTIIPASSDTSTIGSLTAATCYDFYVRDSCGVGDVSNWAGPFNFCTACSPVTAPWIENFDGAAWTNGGAANVIGTIDNCWIRTPITPFAWKTGPAPTQNNLSGPAADHTTGSGNFIYSERINNFAGLTFEAFMETPPVDLSALINPELNFWYHMFGNSVVGLNVEVNNGSGWTSVFSRTGQQNTSGTDPWLESLVDLSAYANDTIVVRFSSINNNGGTNNDISIDDVKIDNAASCPDPQNFEVLGFTNSSVTLAWTSGGSQWNVEYGAPGFAQGSGTQVLATSNPFTISGLSPNTSYDFYVRDSCGPTDLSSWVGSVTAETDCNPVTAPLIENFDGAAWVQGTVGAGAAPGTLANCWRANPSNDFTFTPGQNATPSNNTGPDADHTTGTDQYLYSETYYNFAGFNPNETSLYTPLVDLSNSTVPELKFYYHMFGGDITSMEVRIFNGSAWTSALTLTGQQNTSSADPWIEAIVDLAAFVGDTVKVEFKVLKGIGVSIAADVAIDDLSIDEAPLCPKPTNFVTTASTLTSIDFSWTTGGAVNWQMEYGPSGYVPGTGTVVSVTTNPFTLGSLNPSTTYDVYIRDSCSVGSVSEWVGPVLASTLCGVSPAPYLETFDGGNFDPGAQGFGVAGTIDACWARNPATVYFWKSGPSTPQTGGTGPSVDHTSGSGGYLFTESGGFAQPTLVADAETPEIDLSTLISPELTFWHHMFGPNVGSLDVEISNDGGLTWTNLITITGQQQTAQTDAWIETIIDISTYANDTVQVKFIATKTTFGNQSDIAIDDVNIDEAPLCPKPSNLQVLNTGSGDITVSWTTGGATNWQIEYGPIGFVNGSGTILNVPSNPFTITGLSPSTAYDIYVRDSCGIGNTSQWSNVATDSTKCSVFSAPYTENFDGSSFVVGGGFANPGAIDACWERVFDNTYFWAPEQNGTVSNNTGPDADHTTGTGKFMFSDGFGQPQQTELLSPLVDLSTLSNPELRFWYHMYGASINRMEIEVWDGSSWINELTLTGQAHNASSDPWTEAVIGLSAYSGDTVQVRFVAFRQGNTTANDMALDDFWIGDSTGCARPDSAILVNATTNSLSIQWNNYSGIGSVIEYRPAGSTGPFIVSKSNGGSLTLSGLSPSTTYEVFLRDSCGPGNISLSTAGYLFSTLCGAITAPWSENFDGAGWTPGVGNNNIGDLINQCWFRNSGTAIRWGTGTGGTNSGQTGPDNDVTIGGQYIYTEATIGQGTSEIESPSIFIPTFLTQPKLAYHYHMFGAGIDSMIVEIDNGSGFARQTSYTGQQQNANNDPWLNDSIDLSNFIGDTIKIRFVGVNSTFQGDIAIDELSITGQISICNDPSSIFFTNIGNTSAEINWTSNSGSSEIEIVLAGQAQGTGTIVTPVTSPFTISTLLPLTSYDVYIRDICGTQFSLWADSTFTTTSCPAVSVLFTNSINLLQANFDGTSSTGADTLVWNFGDGNTFTGPGLSSSNLYSTPGTYNVTLIGYNSCGNADTVMQTIQVCDSVVARFNSNLVGDSLSFDASNSFGASSYRWEFGDGNDTIDIVSGSYRYGGNGTYTVTLTAYNDCGDSSVFTSLVQACGPPVSSWTYTILSTTSAGMQVQFDGTASQNAINYAWSFGDGNTNNVSALPIHTYVVPSLQYTVSLTVTNPCGDFHNKTYRMDQIGIEEEELLGGIEIYPNPANDHIFIRSELDGQKSGSLVIYDLTGKRILEQELNFESDHEERVDIADYPPGHYTLKILVNGNFTYYPLIIK